MKLSRAIDVLEKKIIEYKELSENAKKESETTSDFKNFVNKNSSHVFRERDIISMKRAIKILKQHN